LGKAENQRSEVGGQRSEDGGQRSEDGDQKSEIRGQGVNGKCRNSRQEVVSRGRERRTGQAFLQILLMPAGFSLGKFSLNLALNHY